MFHLDRTKHKKLINYNVVVTHEAYRTLVFTDGRLESLLNDFRNLCHTVAFGGEHMDWA
jgi:hypothetical protein